MARTTTGLLRERPATVGHSHLPRRAWAAVILMSLVCATLVPAACGGNTTASGGSSTPGSAPAITSTARQADRGSAAGTSGAQCGASGAAVPTAADAARALAAFDSGFLLHSAGGAYYGRASSPSEEIVDLSDPWRDAELIETVEDYWGLTRRPAYRREVASLCRGLLALYGRNWRLTYFPQRHHTGGARANDDIMWMVIALARGARITGDREFALVAARNYDAAYARAWSTTFGGGLWWWQYKGKQPGKNATTNAPAVIAACELYRLLHEPLYLDRAISLYTWTRAHLFDPRTGEVYDGIVEGPGGAPRISRVRFSYDQGSFIGAAGLLYGLTGRAAYRRDALLALGYAKVVIAHGRVLPTEATNPNSDAAGFKGIFARWSVWFTRTYHISSFDAWLRLNAAAAWAARDSRDLAGWDWTQRVGGATLLSWDCSSMPAMLECVATRRAADSTR
jgi:hypothetical protein